MLRTRNSFKRTSSGENNNTKKKRISIEDDDLEQDEQDEKSDFDDDTDEDSDYKPKKDEKSSSSESDNGDDETESKFFKSPNKSLIKSSSKNSTKFVEKYKRINSSTALQKITPKSVVTNTKVKLGCDLDSDSSSDEFERAPFSLEELGDFKKISSEIKKEGNDDDFKSSSDSGSNKMKDSDYFDFSQIIQRQELLKSVSMMKSENDKKAEDNEKVNSEVDRTKERNKKYIRKKIRGCKNRKIESDNINKSSSDLNVMELLKLGEGTSQIKDEDSDDYEDENDIVSIKNENEPKNIQVTIELPGLECKKEKKKSDIEAAIKRRFNLIKKENQIYAHKVHLLCWIAHGNYVNSILNSETLTGIALSLIPSKHCYPPKRCDLNYLEKLVEWYVNKITILKDDERGKAQQKSNLLESLEEQFMKQVAYSRKDLALMFVCMVRALGLTARLIINLRPVPLKPPVNELISMSNKPDKDKSNKNSNKSDSVDEDKKKKESSKSDKSKKTPRATTSKYFSIKGNSNKNKSDDKKSVENKTLPGRTSEKKSVGRKQPQRGGKKSDFINNESLKSANSNKIKLNDVELLESDLEENKSDACDDFVLKKEVKRKPKQSNDKIDRRVLSTDDENDDSSKSIIKKKKNTIDEWAEVFLEAEEKWICADLVRGKIHCTQHLYSAASSPVTYVLGWENNLTIKDVTRRYVPHWMTVTRKQRAEPEWWEETIRPFAPLNNARNREEDEDLDRQLEDQPLPSSVSEYKNHPLYALKRHLLKFQAIYPPDAPTVGFIKSEPVYSRTCVVELHTRESWIKEAKLVRVGEEPYKIVKARPKYDKMTGTVIKDLPLNLYGFWQVDDYIPPPAVDGKVPRNEYGNVELYKECMLPLGTVHLQLPGLNRVAKKLNIDCAPAVVGWDFHGGGSHPVFDGFIVCEEFKDKLLDAWNQEIDESAKRAREKVEQRVYGNWRRIVKGLLIREKLKLRYGFEEVPEEPKSKKKHTSCKKSTKK